VIANVIGSVGSSDRAITVRSSGAVDCVVVLDLDTRHFNALVPNVYVRGLFLWRPNQPYDMSDAED